jgi:hypothetical protein
MTELLFLSLGTTWGLRVADAELAAMLREAGASVAMAGTRIGATDRLRRGYPVNDLVEAIAARRALRTGLARHRPRALVLSTTTAALLAGRPPVPFAIRIDAPALLNRPGRRNLPVRALERRQFARARLILTYSPLSASQLPPGSARSVFVSPPIAPAPPREHAGEALAVAYTPDPKAKGLGLVCRAWAAAAIPGARLVLTGVPAERARAFLARRGIALPANLELAGMLAQDDFRALVGRARVFLTAARWEDFGLAPLEALERGAALVCAPGGGPFPALAIARALEPRFVAADRSPEAVAGALRAAFAAPEPALAAYRAAARKHLEPYRRAAQLQRLRDDVLPVLLEH